MNSLERNCAEGAYFFKTHGYYGSMDAAIRALKRRKDTKEYSREFLREAFDHALAILERQEELGRKVLKQNGTSFHPQLTQKQFEAGSAQIRESLLADFPDDTETIEYFIGMNWHMPYVR